MGWARSGMKPRPPKFGTQNAGPANHEVNGVSAMVYFVTAPFRGEAGVAHRLPRFTRQVVKAA